jgi:hypothetical protein
VAQQAYDLVDGSYRRVVAGPGEPTISAQRLLLDWYTHKSTVSDDPPLVS